MDKYREVEKLLSGKFPKGVEIENLLEVLPDERSPPPCSRKPALPAPCRTRHNYESAPVNFHSRFGYCHGLTGG